MLIPPDKNLFSYKLEQTKKMTILDSYQQKIFKRTKKYCGEENVKVLYSELSGTNEIMITIRNCLGVFSLHNTSWQVLKKKIDGMTGKKEECFICCCEVLTNCACTNCSKYVCFECIYKSNGVCPFCRFNPAGNT